MKYKRLLENRLDLLFTFCEFCASLPVAFEKYMPLLR
jgi:hypothetical protein